MVGNNLALVEIVVHSMFFNGYFPIEAMTYGGGGRSRRIYW